MRRISTIFSIFLLVVSIGLVFACAGDVPARITMSPRGAITPGASIFVIGRSQHERVLKSLVDAGVNATDQGAGHGYSLTVSIGGSRGSSQPCGTVNNVTYVLNGNGMRLMVIKGRGATGSCEPNIFDEMSRLLATVTTPR